MAGPNLIGTDNTEYGIVTDNSALMGALKYSWNRFRFFAGYEYIWQDNPSNPLGVGATAQGGYRLSGVEDDDLDSPKRVQIWWTGAKYAIDKKTDVTFAWYRPARHALAPKQPVSAPPARAPSTSGRSIRIATSPSVSTCLPGFRIPT